MSDSDANTPGTVPLTPLLEMAAEHHRTDVDQPEPYRERRVFQQSRAMVNYRDGLPVVVLGVGDEAREVADVYRVIFTLDAGPGLPTLALYTVQPEPSAIDIPEALVLDVNALLARLERYTEAAHMALPFAREVAERAVRMSVKESTHEMPDYLAVRTWVDQAMVTLHERQPRGGGPTVGKACADAWQAADDWDGIEQQGVVSLREMGEVARALAVQVRTLADMLMAETHGYTQVVPPEAIVSTDTALALARCARSYGAGYHDGSNGYEARAEAVVAELCGVTSAQAGDAMAEALEASDDPLAGYYTRAKSAEAPPAQAGAPHEHKYAELEGVSRCYICGKPESEGG